MSLIKVHREKREIVMSCTIWPPDSISDGWTVIALSVLRAIRNRPTHCPSSDHYAYVLTYTPGNANTHYSMKKTLGPVRYGVLESEWGPFSRQWSWWWSPSQRWGPAQGRECLPTSLYYHLLNGLWMSPWILKREGEREMDGGTEMAPIGKVGSQRGTAVRVWVRLF